MLNRNSDRKDTLPNRLENILKYIILFYCRFTPGRKKLKHKNYNNIYIDII